jgi:hypothetical protein
MIRAIHTLFIMIDPPRLVMPSSYTGGDRPIAQTMRLIPQMFAPNTQQRIAYNVSGQKKNRRRACHRQDGSA